MVGCKLHSKYPLLLTLLLELIDTQWDVNVLPKTYAKLFEEELIDTQWDVNTWKQQEKTAESQRINRYIVECKSANRCNFKRNVFHRYAVALVQL